MGALYLLGTGLVSGIAEAGVFAILKNKKKKKGKAETDGKLLVYLSERKTSSTSWRPAGTSSSGSLWGSKCPLAVS